MERNHRYKEKNSHGSHSDYHYLMAEMKAQNFDVIKFATYRTASKLRFIQKKTNMHLLDIWNIIEAFRENGLNALDSRLELTIPRLETLVHSIYFQLNKRLPVSQQIDVEYSATVLVKWFLATYDPEETGTVRVFSVKIALAIICAGKITDKLRYIFSLISDINGNMVFSKFADFLKEAMGLPCSVYESPSFFFTDSLPRTIFDGQSTITVNDFLDILLSDPGPQCLMWFPLIHRMASVENVLHTVQCEGCNKESFVGFRYKCQRCYNYQLCQDCFWRCRVSGNHTNQHEMKEYTSYKTPSKQLGHSLKKSVLCIPDKPTNMESYHQDEFARNTKAHQALSAPPANAYNSTMDAFNTSYQTKSALKSSHGKSNYDHYAREDEHMLISNYSNRLYANRRGRYASELNLPSDTARQRELISKLEAKNREIMREIIRLRKQQEEEDEALRSDRKPTLLTELRALRMRKHDLERHLSSLQESRRDLVLQLEVLMRMLKDHSPLSSPNSSPLYPLSVSPIPLYPLSSMSAPATPGSGCPYTDPLIGLGGDVRLAFGQAASTRSLQNDLLVAADSVTNAMSSLVKQLNIGCDDDELDYSVRNPFIDGMESDINGAYENDTWPGAVNGIDYQIGYPNSYLLDSTDIYEDESSLPMNGTYPSHPDGIEWEDDTTRWVNR
ncbi:dystrobrevin beta [Parasteatoda tepidariorum]|uniref:dystrobrevin beta n=1 Tax=Parasteatoda tepidariorum TaxID=114398 RepID=UPI00077F9C4A|nr:dystrobrevin beta [Parasteatoda tepidariorum]